MSQIGFSHPTEPIEVPRIVARICRGIDAELCPLEVVSPIYVGCICERVPLWVPLKPHLIDQTGEFFYTSHCVLHCVGQLVAARKWVPNFDDKDIRFIETSLSSDFQRWATQSVSVHLLLRYVHPSGCKPRSASFNLVVSTPTRIKLSYRKAMSYHRPCRRSLDHHHRRRYP